LASYWRNPPFIIYIFIDTLLNDNKELIFKFYSCFKVKKTGSVGFAGIGALWRGAIGVVYFVWFKTG
jgi:hypothetical protein